MAPGFRRRVGAKGGGSAATRYQRQFRGAGASGSGEDTFKNSRVDHDDESRANYRRQKQAAGEVLDESFGVERFALFHQHHVNSKGNKDGGPARERRGWLYNMLATTVRFDQVDHLWTHF